MLCRRRHAHVLVDLAPVRGAAVLAACWPFVCPMHRAASSNIKEMQRKIRICIKLNEGVDIVAKLDPTT